MPANNFEALFGENIVEDASPTTTKKRKPKLVPIRPTTDSHPAKLGDEPHVRVDQIIVKQQHRTVFEEIVELAASIDAHGLIQPLLVRPSEEHEQMFELVAGERRFRAVKHLGLEMVPCVIKQLSRGEVSALQLAENLNRKNLNPIEEARAFSDVIRQNDLTLEAVAKMYGRNKGTVSRSLQLLELPSDVQQQIADGQLAPSVARQLKQLPTDSAKQEIAATVLSDSLTEEQTKELVQKRVGKAAKRQPKNKTLTWPLEHGQLAVTVSADATYHHVKAVMEEALADVQIRLDNGLDL